MSRSHRISFTESPNGISHGHAFDPFAVQNFIGAGRNQWLETDGTNGSAQEKAAEGSGSWPIYCPRTVELGVGGSRFQWHVKRLQSRELLRGLFWTKLVPIRKLAGIFTGLAFLRSLLEIL